MRVRNRYLIEFGETCHFSANAKDDCYRHIIALLIQKVPFSLWINGKRITNSLFEGKVAPVIERFFRRERGLF